MKLIAIVASACIVATLLAVVLSPRRYVARVVILPPQQSASAGAAMMAQMSSAGMLAAAGGTLGIKNPNDQQIALLKSRIVEDALIERFHLQSLYRKKFLSITRKNWEKVTTTDNGLKDGLIRLTVMDSDPNRAAELANGWVDEYKRFTATLALTEASQRRLFYENQLDQARNDLIRAEENMKQTEQRTGIIDVEGQGKGMIETAAVLRGQLAAKQIEIKAMRQFAGDLNPDLARSEEEARGMEAQLAAMDVAADRKHGDLITPKGKSTEAAFEYERALREVKYRETIQDLLLRQYEGAHVDEAKQGALIQVIEPAVAPDRPDSSYKLLILLAGLAFAVPLALLVARLAEYMDAVQNFCRRFGSVFGALDAMDPESVTSLRI
ncbi:MAG: chain length determinant family protein [Acidobacteria bacterium]|nr:chain length determinant family protein [Acidobacteriota bacterium]